LSEERRRRRSFDGARRSPGGLGELMGKDASLRYKFTIERARDADDLDV
jgi:hypothetical protein